MPTFTLYLFDIDSKVDPSQVDEFQSLNYFRTHIPVPFRLRYQAISLEDLPQYKEPFIRNHTKGKHILLYTNAKTPEAANQIEQFVLSLSISSFTPFYVMNVNRHNFIRRIINVKTYNSVRNVAREFGNPTDTFDEVRSTSCSSEGVFYNVSLVDSVFKSPYTTIIHTLGFHRNIYTQLFKYGSSMIVQFSSTCAISAVLNAFVCSSWGRIICNRAIDNLTAKQKLLLDQSTHDTLIHQDRRTRKSSFFFFYLMHNRISISIPILETIRGAPDIPSQDTDFITDLAKTFDRDVHHHGQPLYTALNEFLKATDIISFCSIDDEYTPSRNITVQNDMFFLQIKKTITEDDISSICDSGKYEPAFGVLRINMIDKESEQLKHHGLAGVFVNGIPYTIDSNDKVFQIDWIHNQYNVLKINSAISKRFTWDSCAIRIMVYKNVDYYEPRNF